MKITTLKTAILFVSFIAVAATSCKKDKKEPEGKAGAATVTASLLGFGSSSAKFESNAAAIVKIGPIFNVTAIKNNSIESININLLGVTGTGEYDLDEGNSSGNVAYLFKDFKKTTEGYSTQLSSSSSVIGGGKVNITKLTDTEAEGTFYIIAHNDAGEDAWVENGKFSGKITAER